MLPIGTLPIGTLVGVVLVSLLSACGSAVITESDVPAPALAETALTETALAETAPAATGFTATVDRVVDGDTIVVSINGSSETVRLLGIDTPEKPGGPRPAECFGVEASAFAEALLPSGTRVGLSRDVETRDQFGRLLAYVHRANDDVFVNLAMVEHGYATPLFFSPNMSQRESFTAAAATARREWRGFWPHCGAADVVLSPAN